MHVEKNWATFASERSLEVQRPLLHVRILSDRGKSIRAEPCQARYLIHLMGA